MELMEYEPGSRKLPDLDTNEAQWSGIEHRI